jgi:hypothetical protein
LAFILLVAGFPVRFLGGANLVGAIITVGTVVVRTTGFAGGGLSNAVRSFGVAPAPQTTKRRSLGVVFAIRNPADLAVGNGFGSADIVEA